MKHTQEEIINALKVIKDTCEEQQEFDPCKRCPLSKNGACILQEQPPQEWKIRTSPPEWKAFD